jgi:hypothetical protein
LLAGPAAVLVLVFIISLHISCDNMSASANQMNTKQTDEQD